MKKIKMFLALMCTLVLLSGCMSMRVGIVVKSEKELEFNMEVLASPLLTSEMEEGEFRESFEEGLYANGELPVEVKIEDITKEVDGQTWEGVLATIEYSEEQAATMVSLENNKLIFRLPMDDADDMLGDEMSLDELDQATIDMYKQYGVSMLITIEMPSKPTTNVGTVEGNVVTIDLLSDDLKVMEEEGIEISSSNGGVDTTMIIGIVALVAFAAVIAFFLFKKKPQKNTSVEEVISVQENETVSTSEEVEETSEEVEETSEEVNDNSEDTTEENE